MLNNHLIVGLGGSGGKIIREIRKTIERNSNTQGQNPSDAHFEFLYIDTSTDQIDKKDEWKVLGKEVELARSQYLINTAGAIRPVLEDPESFPGLKGWVEPRNVFDFVKPGIAGAAQRRKLGRVVFAQNAPHFIKAVEDRVESLSHLSGKMGAMIHVVCGLAGGTGSGSVADAVAHIRHKYPDPDRYRIVIYAILPEKNSKRVKAVSGFSNYYANGYAALAELNAMAVGKYHPTNLVDGARMQHDIYFNGCYLIGNVNANHIPFDIETEVPNIVAEFIYQKSVNPEWGGLNYAEKGENDLKNFECESPGDKVRAKLFLSFGLKRVIVPEEEIKEYLAYGFAEQSARQLMFNNFRQGEGYADEGVEKDWGFEARKPDTLQSLLLSDAHLLLETGILQDDASNNSWKPIGEYWQLIVSTLAPQIQNDATVEQTGWISVLNSRLAKVFEETYRTMGGVRKFYEVKGNARLEMAKHIARHIERDFFSRWKAGTVSLLQLRQFTDALVAVLDEKFELYSDRIARMPALREQCEQRINELGTRFNNIGFFGKHLTDKRESLFSEIAARHHELYVLRTTLEGLNFATRLIPFIKEQLLGMRGTIDSLQQNLASATEKFRNERASRLGEADAAYQKRIFNQDDITAVMKALIVDEESQAARTQQVRQAIIELAGKETDQFDKIGQSVSLSSIISTLSQQAGTIVEMAHAEIAKTLRPVLHVNIVERLQKQYDANEKGLKEFVRKLYDDAGNLLIFNKTEVDRTVDGTHGYFQTTGIFLPDCEHQKEFRASLASLFEAQKDPGSDTVVSAGKQSNQIVMMKISSLMPARFIESLAELKRHYDGLLKDTNESYLLHSEGNGSKLPSLFARSSAEMKSQAKRKPYLLLARVLGMLKERQNRTTGLMEWAFVYISDGLPASKVLSGKNWNEVLDGDHAAEFESLVEQQVLGRIQADFRHVDKKNELMQGYRDIVIARFNEAGDDDTDPDYVVLKNMSPLVRDIIGFEAA